MTDAMWFAWLLRADVRAGRAVTDDAGQRDFVAWWLLFGGIEYPNAWWYWQAQVDVAMEAAPAATAIPIPRLLLALHASRPDLMTEFNLHDVESAANYLCWYRLFGPAELRAAPPLPAHYLPPTEAPSRRFRRAPVPRMALAFWDRSVALQSIMDAKQEGHRSGLARWYATQGVHKIPAPTPLPDWPEIRPALVRRRPDQWPPAINLVGYARAEFGIGEDVRMMSRALEAVGVEHTIVDLPVAAEVRAEDMSRAAWIGPPSVGAVNIFCLTGFDMAQVFLERGLAPFEGAYNFGYWPWELPRFPDQWCAVYGLVDEVWGATAFQAAAYRANSPVPVAHMPPAITPPAVPRRVRRRNGTFRFFYPFDPKSTLARKNPIAAVRAFRAAFPAADRGVELVLRLNGVGAGRPGWRALRAAMRGDTRIRVMEGTLSRHAAHRLLQSASCLVSPHRAEGLGRNIAEAIALGVPVLATGFSGSGELLMRRERIPAKPRRVQPGEYPHADGLWWSEPDIAVLARQMRALRRRQARSLRPVPARRARLLLDQYGLASAGHRYATRVSQIVSALQAPGWFSSGEADAMPLAAAQ